MGTLMWRWNFAMALAGGKQAGARVNLTPLAKALHSGKPAAIATWFSYFVGRRPSTNELAALSTLPLPPAFGERSHIKTAEQMAGLILASPAFQRC